MTPRYVVLDANGVAQFESDDRDAAFQFLAANNMPTLVDRSIKPRYVTGRPFTAQETADAKAARHW